MLRQLRPALVTLALLTALLGLVYPLGVTGMAQLLFPHQANGSLIVVDGRTVGSELIGQAFDAGSYFWGRPSATAGRPYNGSASGGSNLGPSNPALVEAVAARLAVLRAADPANAAGPEAEPVPGDLVTASASGLDPDISLAAALFQVPRVAQARGLLEPEVEALVRRLAKGRQRWLLGEPRVNVLDLNLALDAVQ